jgi:AcrR family transcriptional regulator
MSPRTEEQFAQIRTDRKLAILDAALHIFAEEGYHASSISKIAAKASISKGLMYNYFESKQDLLIELFHSKHEKIIEIMELDPKQKMTPENIINMIEKTMMIIDGDRAYWKVYFSLVSQPQILEIATKEMMPRIQPFMMGLLDFFKEQGHDNPMAMMRYFLATMDGAKMQYLFDPDNFPIEEIKKYIINQFILK